MHDAIIIIVGFVAYFIGAWVERRTNRLQFNWECTHHNCIFKVQSNNKKGLDVLVKSHHEYHDTRR